MGKDANAPKRPLSGYFRFVSTIRAEIEKETGLKGTKLAPIFAQKWKELPQEEKEVLQKQYQEEAIPWKKAMEEYKKTDTFKEYLKSKTAKKFKKAPKDKNAPKKPLSAFFLFSNSVRDQVRAELNTTRLALVGKKIGEMWGTVSEEEKAKFKEQAKIAKEQYAKDFAAYKETDDYKTFLSEKNKYQSAKKRAMKRMKAL